MDANLNYNEIYNIYDFFSLVNQKHNPFSSCNNYSTIQVTVRLLIAELSGKGIKYLYVEYDNGIELIDMRKLHQRVTIDFLHDIIQAIIEYDMTPNQSVKLGKFIKINFREAHNLLKELRI
ncbi:MAG: hypothetical protein RSC93_00320 [Erysipelotrichaceae bacterium]